MHKSTQPDTLAYPVTPRRDRGCVDDVAACLVPARAVLGSHVLWGLGLRCPGGTT